MNQPDKVCRTCGVVNEASAYACASCGVSLRLSPPMRPAPALRAPIVAPKSNLANDTLDIETELPDEELDQLLASHTPAPHVGGLDELATLDEAADGLAPSVSFDDLQVLSPEVMVRPALPLQRKERSLQDSIGVEPLIELPQHTEILNKAPRATSSAARWILVLIIGISGGAAVSRFLTMTQGSERPMLQRLTQEAQQAPSPVSRSYGAVSIRPQLESLTSPEVGVDPVVLRAQAKAWSRVSAAAADEAVSRFGAQDLRAVHAQLTLLEARIFETELEPLRPPSERPRLNPVASLSASEQKRSRELELTLNQAPQDLAGLRRELRVWLYSLSGRYEEAAMESLQEAQASSSPLRWTLALPALSAGDVSEQTLELLKSGSGCERALYALRATELSEGRGELLKPYQRFSDCLTQLIAQEHLSATPLTQVEPAARSTKRTDKRQRAQRGTGRVAGLGGAGGYESLMKQGVKALERGRVGQAEAYFKRASVLKPKDPDPISQRGWCALAKGKARSSLRHFKTALSLKSDHEDSLYGLGYAYEQLKEWEVARGHFKRYLSLYPSGSKVRIIENKLNRMPK